MIQAFKNIEASPIERLVGYMLADAHNDQSGRCDLSIASLIDLTSLSERAVQNALKSLDAAGHITRIFRPGTSTQYRLHPRTTCPPASDAPPQDMHQGGAGDAPHPRTTCTPPPQEVHLTPAPRAPNPERTGIEPSSYSPPGELGLDGETRKAPAPPPPPKPKTKKPTDADPRHREFIEAYTADWQDFHGDKYPFQAADGVQLAQLLKTSSLTTSELMAGVVWCWEQARENQFAPKPVKQAATIRGFCSAYPAIVAAAQQTQSPRNTRR